MNHNCKNKPTCYLVTLDAGEWELRLSNTIYSKVNIKFCPFCGEKLETKMYFEEDYTVDGILVIPRRACCTIVEGDSTARVIQFNEAWYIISRTMDNTVYKLI